MGTTLQSSYESALTMVHLTTQSPIFLQFNSKYYKLITLGITLYMLIYMVLVGLIVEIPIGYSLKA